MQQKKEVRRRAIVELIRSKSAVTQVRLVEALRTQGYSVTQSTVSRDLAELGAVKVDGAYRLPESRAGEPGLLELLSVEAVADHLVVIRTPVGQASPVAVAIDRAGFAEIAGTLAGDDTIFIAVRNSADQRRAIKDIVGLFGDRA